MVLKLPEVANLNSLGMLCSNDAEVDFFNNIIHLQVSFLCYFLLRLHMFFCLSLSELYSFHVLHVILELFMSNLLDNNHLALLKEYDSE